MVNQKAQVGDTMTWIIAFVIVFFIMMIFILGASSGVATLAFNKNSIEFSELQEAIDYEITLDLLEFMKTHDSEFLKWTNEDDISGICSIFRTEMLQNYKSLNHFIYFESEGKRIYLDYNEYNAEFNCNSLGEGFKVDELNDLSGAEINTFYIFSNNKLVKIIYMKNDI